MGVLMLKLLNLKAPKTPVGILRKVPSAVHGSGEKTTVPKRKVSSQPKSVKIDETSFEDITNSSPRSMQRLDNQISECLRLEQIDLTKTPYSTEVSSTNKIKRCYLFQIYSAGFSIIQ